MSGYPETVLTKQWKFVRTIKTFTLLSHQDSAGGERWCGRWCWCSQACTEIYQVAVYLTLCWPGDPS